MTMTAAVFFLSLAGLAYKPSLVPSLLQILFPGVLWEGKTSAPLVALTFDDGPDPRYTPVLLDALRNLNVKATFFLVGERARQYPEIVHAIRAGGHEIGNHTDSWRRTVALGCEEFRRDLLRAEEALGLLHTAGKFFRPAGGLARPCQIRIAREQGYRPVLGSAYAFDPRRPPAAFIVWLIERALHPGSIIVLHDSGGDRSATVRAVPEIVAGARRNGLDFTTVSGLLESRSGPTSRE
ncbi:MAG: polysaccharide deacetylase family protein [Acidobacteria bacterium]|nr:polysaccharide deacetylase family protein [Acidobacteriota bacterium]